MALVPYVQPQYIQPVEYVQPILPIQPVITQALIPAQQTSYYGSQIPPAIFQRNQLVMADIQKRRAFIEANRVRTAQYAAQQGIQGYNAAWNMGGYGGMGYGSGMGNYGGGYGGGGYGGGGGGYFEEDIYRCGHRGRHGGRRRRGREYCPECEIIEEREYDYYY